MDTFAQVIRDAERHLEAAESSAAELSARIQAVSRACSQAEADVAESTRAIAASEAKLKVLAGQQSDTRKKLTALYHSLIAVPSVTATGSSSSSGSGSGSSIGSSSGSGRAQGSSVSERDDPRHSPLKRDDVIFNICFYNALTSTRSVDSLVRHSHFAHSTIKLKDSSEASLSPRSSVERTNVAREDRIDIDTFTPLCMYALTGECTDKNCCFQHLTTDGKRKVSAGGRSWRSLKFQKYLKQNIRKFQLNCESTRDIPAPTLNDPVELPLNKKRYFDETLTSINTTLSTEITRPAPVDNSIEALNIDQIYHWKAEYVDIMYHCMDLWTSCQVTPLVSCLYQCLHIDGGLDLLPFGFMMEGSIVESSADGWQDFVQSNRTEQEVRTAYATLVYLLVSGDFIGVDLLQNEQLYSDNVKNSPLTNIFVVPTSRKRLLVKKWRVLVTQIPHFAKKVVCLLQQAHDAMHTNCEVEFDAKFKISCNNLCDDKTVSTQSHSYQVLWLCTSVLAEACLISEDVVIARNTLQHETAAQLVDLYTGFLVLNAPKSCNRNIEDSHTNTESSSRYADHIDFRFINFTVIMSYVDSTTFDSVLWSTGFDKAAFPESVNLSLVTNRYCSGDIDFDAYITEMLTQSKLFRKKDLTDAVVFSCGKNRWELLTSVLDDDIRYTNYICSSDHERTCIIALINEPCDAHSSAAAVKEIDHVSKMSMVEMKHMLREVFVNIVSIKICSNVTANDGENMHYSYQGDVNAIISIWLCIGQLCDLFSPPRPSSFVNNNTIQRDVSYVDSDKIMRRFFCNSLRSIISGRGHDIESDIENAYDNVSVGMTILRMLLLFSKKRIERIWSYSMMSTSDDEFRSNFSDQQIRHLLSLVIAVGATIKCYCNVRDDSLSHLSQFILETVLSNLKVKQLLSLSHIIYVIDLIQQGSYCRRVESMPARWQEIVVLRDNLSEFYTVCTPVSTGTLSHAFSEFLSSEIINHSFDKLDNEMTELLSSNNRNFFLHPNIPSVERGCLKIAQCLKPNEITPILNKLEVSALFQLAMVYFIAEDFDALVYILRVLVDKKHPLSMVNFSRIFGVCLEAESLSTQKEIMNEIYSAVHLAEFSPIDEKGLADDISTRKRRRESIIQSWHTYLEEDFPLWEHYSLEKLVYMTELVSTSTFMGEQQQVQCKTIDLSVSSSKGILPAALTVLVEKKNSYPVGTLYLSHNSIRSFPLVLLDLSTLLRLDLSWNLLKSMPSGIDQLLNLQVLNLSHNQFEYFPSSVLKLKSSLQELYLQDNKIEEIRNDFLKLSSLQVLDVSNNLLRNIPSRLNAHIKLKFFRFSGNPIFDIVAAEQPNNQKLGSGIFKFSSTSGTRSRKKPRKLNRKKK